MGKIILISCVAVIAFSVFYYLVIFIPHKEQMQIDLQKQELQVKQQSEKEARDAAQQADTQKQSFDNELKCRALYDKLNNEFNNIAGTYYSSILNTCMVKFFKDGKTEETTIADFEKNAQ
jgi:hypothetical protein